MRQPANSIARFAAAHKIPFEIVDGNDIVAVAEATERLVSRSRAGEGPGFLEAVTYRWRGHVGPREDIDVGVARKTDLALWKKRDPVGRLVMALESAGHFSGADFESLQQEVQDEVDTEWQRAEDAPFPLPSATLNRVYASEASL